MYLLELVRSKDKDESGNYHADGETYRLLFKQGYGRSALDAIKEEDIAQKIIAGKYEGWVKGKCDGIMTIELTDPELRYLYYLIFDKLGDGFIGSVWGGIVRRLKDLFDESGLDPIKRDKAK